MSTDYERFKAILADEALPAALVDLDAVDANIATLRAALGTGAHTLRVASKSIRHPRLIRYILEHGGERFRGLMTYSAAETAFLAAQGFDDLLLAYPVARRPEASLLASAVAGGADIIVTIDATEQLRVVDDAAATTGVRMKVCLDVDASWRPLGNHFGVRRSPIRDARSALDVARRARDLDHIDLVAVLAYEAQVAGMQDRNRGSRYLDPIRQLIKQRSVPVVRERRREVVETLRGDGFDIRVVNGGGTGSVHLTTQEDHVTEVTAGSGFLCPHLFDGYDAIDLVPAAFFAIPVVRRSDPDHVTCASGGFLASGPGQADRMPLVHLPVGLTPVSLEGWGEVQTPFKVTSGPAPAHGDPVICRHAKGGELAERFDTYLLVRGDEVVERAPTYRGLGATFP